MCNRDSDSDCEAVVFSRCGQACGKSGERVANNIAIKRDAPGEEKGKHHPEQERGVARKKVIVLNEPGGGRKQQRDKTRRIFAETLPTDPVGKCDSRQIHADHE